jgi:hypothetical protein
MFITVFVIDNDLPVNPYFIVEDFRYEHGLAQTE